MSRYSKTNRKLLSALTEGVSDHEEPLLNERISREKLPDQNKDRIGKSAIINGEVLPDLLVLDYGLFYRRSTGYLIYIEPISGESSTMHLSKESIKILSRL